MSVFSAAFSDDGTLFTDDGEGHVVRWNTGDGTYTFIEQSELPVVCGLASLGDSRFVAIFSASNTPDPSTTTELRIFDVESKATRLIRTHGNQLARIAVDATKTLLVTSSNNGIARVGPVTGEEPHVLFAPGKNLLPLPWVSPDGLWVGWHDSYDLETSYLWRTPRGRPIHTLPHDEFLAHLRAQTNLRVVPDKKSQTGYRVDIAPFPGWEKLPPQ